MAPTASSHACSPKSNSLAAGRWERATTVTAGACDTAAAATGDAYAPLVELATTSRPPPPPCVVGGTLGENGGGGGGGGIGGGSRGGGPWRIHATPLADRSRLADAPAASGPARPPPGWRRTSLCFATRCRAKFSYLAKRALQMAHWNGLVSCGVPDMAATGSISCRRRTGWGRRHGRLRGDGWRGELRGQDTEPRSKGSCAAQDGGGAPAAAVKANPERGLGAASGPLPAYREEE